MDSETNTSNDPASAFEALRGEISLSRRAVEGLTAERQSAPNYKPTLAAMAERLAAIEHSPAIQLTPEVMKAEVVHIAEQASAKDRETIARTSANLLDTLGIVYGLIERAFTADRQNRWLLATGIAGLLGGILLWSAVPGIVARALPPNWHVPERIAARTLRLDMRDAGKRLIVLGDQSESSSKPERATVSGPIEATK